MFIIVLKYIYRDEFGKVMLLVVFSFYYNIVFKLIMINKFSLL